MSEDEGAKPAVEETGLALWGEVGIDLDLKHLARKKLCACGERAVVAVRRLDEQGRVFYCEVHRRVAGSPPGAVQD